ncbi:MAG: anaerobic ribonucleoside-triphosphate reductase activating protein [Methanomassiliicoccaceae archaeon]|jgi:pyruvate formate lyase activating enzyme|nr:anaerobic ribonucleoside-triphosphate reductase activating protein [Methanomassiliicoccaceae archaeon]
MKIAGFIKTTLLDWDGLVACTVYLAGCNFRCPYCHNAEIVVNADAAERVDEDAVIAYIEEHSDFIDGVVVSGGEPLMNKDIGRFLKRLRSVGVKVKVDTNGMFPDMLDDLIGAGLIDMVAMDIKSSLNERYDMAAGSDTDLSKIRKSIDIVMNSGVDHEFRTTAVPVFVKEDDIRNICENIRGAKRYRIHQFRNKVTIDDSLSVLDPYPESKLTAMAEIAKEYVGDVKIRGT